MKRGEASNDSGCGVQKALSPRVLMFAAPNAKRHSRNKNKNKNSSNRNTPMSMSSLGSDLALLTEEGG